MHWKTLQKILQHSEPPGYRREVSFNKPKIGPFLDRIRQILEEDRRVPKKQRHTAKRIFERIQKEDYTGGYTQVKEAVREIKQKGQEVFVPLIHRPGEVSWTSDFDVHGRTVNSARNQNFETGRLIVDRIR